MISQGTRFWTFDTLVGAFLDLFIAYFLLCGSTIVLFAVKFLGLFGLSLPIPNNGFIGIPNSDFKSLLVDYPTDKISAVQLSVTRKFPFDSIFFRIQNSNANGGLDFDRGDVNGDRSTELEGEASCSSKSDARKLVRNETEDSGTRTEKEKQRGFDMKGKGAVNHRVRGGLRRRRKGSVDHGKHSSVSSSPNWITCIDQQSNEKDDSIGLEDSSMLSAANNGNYEAETPMAVKSDDNSHEDIVSSEPGNLSDAREMISNNDDDKFNTIVSLTRELEEEQAARASLYVELEKERNAAATAADEAMAMILRLQEEKASIEMESRQYQRMIEEKSAYDEEEMNILKEIVLRREREKHFLEKEVEMYRQMIYGDNVPDFTEDPELMLQQLSMSIAKRKNLSETDDINKELQERTIATVEEERSLEMESPVYDVHVINDNDPKSIGNSNSNGIKKDYESGGSFLRKLEKEADERRSVSETNIGLPPMSSKNLRRNSTSAMDHERTRLDTEVEWLRERLRVVQEGREKLNFSIDNREKESLQLQLLEDIARQLQEIRMLTEPRKARQASLPLASAKSSTKKRRCRSASTGPAKRS